AAAARRGASPLTGWPRAGRMGSSANQRRRWAVPFGVRLRELREKAGLSQSGLAEGAGVPIDSIQNWEQGRTRPRIEALGKLARALGVTVDELLQEQDERPGQGAKRPRKGK